MTLFQVEKSPTRLERRVNKFKTFCDQEAIIKCYENKLIYNCSYSIEVEEIIKKIEIHFSQSEELPWWLDLID